MGVSTDFIVLGLGRVGMGIYRDFLREGMVLDVREVERAGLDCLLCYLVLWFSFILVAFMSFDPLNKARSLPFDPWAQEQIPPAARLCNEALGPVKGSRGEKGEGGWKRSRYEARDTTLTR